MPDEERHSRISCAFEYLFLDYLGKRIIWLIDSNLSRQQSSVAMAKRTDLIIPYQLPVVKESSSDFSGTLGNTLPMAAMFTRNKFVGWASVIFAIQNWLGESTESKKATGQPAIFTVGMSIIALLMTYLPMFLPPASASGKGINPETTAMAAPTT